MSAIKRLHQTLCITILVGLLSACALLPSFGKKTETREQVYTLDPTLIAVDADSVSCGSIALGDSMAAPGYRTSRMAYSTAPYEIDYFAYARWADSVARLLRLPLQRGFEAHAGFSEVLAAPTIAPTRFRIEVSDVSLIQKFETRQSARSTVELGASLRVFELNPNRVLATKNYLLSEPAEGTPQGGVAAANVLVGRLVSEAVTFTGTTCAAAL